MSVSTQSRFSCNGCPQDRGKSLTEKGGQGSAWHGWQVKPPESKVQSEEQVKVSDLTLAQLMADETPWKAL